MQTLINRSAKFSIIIGSLSLLALALQGPGYQAGWWDLSFSFFKIFKYVVYTGGIAVLLGLIGILGAQTAGRKTFFMGLIGLTLGLATAFVPLQMRKMGQSVPPIHDITTNINQPPEFIAIAPLRADAPNPISYDTEVAEQQLAAFPDIKTIETTESHAKVFAAAESALKQMKLEIVNVCETSGILEATDTTTWFGFKDDIVVRISKNDSSTLVDVRSKSRVGRSDLGMNAKRIRRFNHLLLNQLNQ